MAAIFPGLKQSACGELSHLHRASHCLLFFAGLFRWQYLIYKQMPDLQTDSVQFRSTLD